MGKGVVATYSDFLNDKTESFSFPMFNAELKMTINEDNKTFTIEMIDKATKIPIKGTDEIENILVLIETLTELYKSSKTVE